MEIRILKKTLKKIEIFPNNLGTLLTQPPDTSMTIMSTTECWTNWFRGKSEISNWKKEKRGERRERETSVNSIISCLNLPKDLGLR